jgi:hypothetical protein
VAMETRRSDRVEARRLGNVALLTLMLCSVVVLSLGRFIPIGQSRYRSPPDLHLLGVTWCDLMIRAGWLAVTIGGPLIDSYGHAIGVNTATFTRKGNIFHFVP